MSTLVLLFCLKLRQTSNTYFSNLWDLIEPSLFPAELHYSNFSLNENADILKTSRSDLALKNEFLKTVKSKLLVAQVCESVENNARLTFDYLALTILASLIASLGLAENSSVVLVASMLISPIMGPIMGGTFGVVVHNRRLAVLGVKNEVIGLLICIITGFIFGLLCSMVNISGAVWGSSNSWPTMEMKSRGLARSLWVGMLIALPSGAGVALSILGGNTGSLVGVAISASLLPPAVNAGILWAYSIVTSISPPATNILQNINQSSVGNVSKCPVLKNNEYEFSYSCDMGQESAILGLVSLMLTFLNILCILIMGVLVLKIKEVAPKTALSAHTERFWKKDIKIGRDAYKTLQGSERMDLGKQIVNEMKKLEIKDQVTFKKSQSDPDLSQILSRMKKTNSFTGVMTRVPGIGPHLEKDSKTDVEENFIDLMDIENHDDTENQFTIFDSYKKLHNRKFDYKPLSNKQSESNKLYNLTLSNRPRNQRKARNVFNRMVSCPSIKMEKESVKKGRFIVRAIDIVEENESD